MTIPGFSSQQFSYVQVSCTQFQQVAVFNSSRFGSKQVWGKKTTLHAALALSSSSGHGPKPFWLRRPALRPVPAKCHPGEIATRTFRCGGTQRTCRIKFAWGYWNWGIKPNNPEQNWTLVFLCAWFLSPHPPNTKLRMQAEPGRQFVQVPSAIERCSTLWWGEGVRGRSQHEGQTSVKFCSGMLVLLYGSCLENIVSKFS